MKLTFEKKQALLSEYNRTISVLNGNSDYMATGLRTEALQAAQELVASMREDFKKLEAPEIVIAPADHIPTLAVSKKKDEDVPF